jgi:hypothetical protein
MRLLGFGHDGVLGIDGVEDEVHFLSFPHSHVESYVYCSSSLTHERIVYGVRDIAPLSMVEQKLGAI